MNKFILHIMSYSNEDAIIWSNITYSYNWLLSNINNIETKLNKYGINNGAIVEIIGDCSPTIIALLFALVNKQCIIIPYTISSLKKQPDFHKIMLPEFSIIVDKKGLLKINQYAYQKNKHKLLIQLAQKNHPGLILFTSGSTGNPKAIVHDWNLLINKYNKKNNTNRVLAFLLFDHIGGLNTILYTLYNGGCLVIPNNISTDTVCLSIQNYKVDLLPTSPTFLNLLIINKCHIRYDLSSLKKITYGTESMLPILLKTLHKIFPNTRFLQTYGLSEMGIINVSSESSDSLGIKLNPKFYRIVNDILEVKTNTAMLGYLNFQDTFLEKGWFCTGDMVKQEGDYFYILGRVSEIINVGGLKVFPLHIENIIKQMNYVDDVVVIGEKSSITGQIVKAIIKLSIDESMLDFRKRMRKFCMEKLQDFEIPQKIVLVSKLDYGDRMKKMKNLI
ncbi:fatty acid--CoA ligase family protein [Gammaproteobacteria bacterium]|nr:fatty acid--CoA ligase family protein [Gammaproteobacteria bacterium]